jgi:hypothetical protein
MDYDFSRKEREFGRVVLALAIDRKKMTERVVIARSDEARLRFQNGTGEAYYDETRPLASLLIGFGGDPKREWNAQGMKLRDSYSKIFPFESERWKMAAPVSKYLRKKYSGGEPSLMFAAIRTWEEYLSCYNMSHGADVLTERLNLLYRPFFLFDERKPWQEEPASALSRVLSDEESQVSLWYPVKKRPFEVVAASASMLPVVSYYQFKLDEWGVVFHE